MMAISFDFYFSFLFKLLGSFECADSCDCLSLGGRECHKEFSSMLKRLDQLLRHIISVSCKHHDKKIKELKRI